MKLYLVRHGEVNHNLYSLHNREDEDLNETGIKQAKELRKKIKKIEYDFIISQGAIHEQYYIFNFLSSRVHLEDTFYQNFQLFYHF